MGLFKTDRKAWTPELHMPEIPMPEVKPPKKDLSKEVDKLYLEKCMEINKLERMIEGQKRALCDLREELKAQEAELEKMRAAQDGELISRSEVLKVLEAAHSRILHFNAVVPDRIITELNDQLREHYEHEKEKIMSIPAVSGAAAAERTAKELEEEIAKQWETWQKMNAPYCFDNVATEPMKLQEGIIEPPVTAQDILCLSSALKNLYDIHKCDGWLLYNKLSKVLDRAIDEYSGKE